MNRMYCGTCSKKFTMLRKKKQCCECKGFYCRLCVMSLSSQHFTCGNCAILTARPLNRAHLLKLKPRDLQLYLNNRQISTRGCVEKEDLVNLLLAHVNSTADTSHRNHRSDNTHRNFFDNIRALFTSTPDISGPSYNSNQPNSSFINQGIFQTTHSTQSSPGTATRTHFSPHVSTEVQNEIVDHNPGCSTSQQCTSNSDQASSQDVPNLEVSNSEIPNLEVSNSEIPNSEVLNTENLLSEARNADSSSSESLNNVEEKCMDSTNKMNLLIPIDLSNIKSEKQLEELTVKQLKELLVRNRVDFKGCVEKTELLERVSNLWSEHSHSREGLENLPLSDLCKICMDAPIECVILECGHMATCISCGKQLAECPICRRYIIRVVRIFRS